MQHCRWKRAPPNHSSHCKEMAGCYALCSERLLRGNVRLSRYTLRKLLDPNSQTVNV